MKRAIALALLLALLAGCSAAEQPVSTPSADVSAWSFPEGAAPDTEYDRFFWYGFGEDESHDPDAIATEKEMADMLTAVITASGGDVEGWEELTANASDEEIYRDYCAMFLLYAAEHMDATEFTMGFAPYLLGGRTDEDWDAFGTDIRGGYRLFEEGEEQWDRVCVSVSSQMEEDQELNYLNASQNYAVSRLSLITGEPLLDFSYESFTMHLTEPLTYEAAAVAAVRLFESQPEVAELFPEDEAVSERAAELIDEARARRDEILNSETEIVKGDTFIPGETYTGTAYYISNSGDDANDGLSPETAWATIDRLNVEPLQYGDAVFFERGSVWRAAQVYTKPGVTYSAYGEGEKPGLYGSVENGGGAEKWTLWHEGSDGSKIWVYYKPMLDCGSIALNDDLGAIKVQGFWNGEYFQAMSDMWNTDQTQEATDLQSAMPEFDPAEQLTEDLTFFCDASSGLPSTLPIYLSGWYDTGGEPYCLTADGPLYLRCDEGNPGELYPEMEFLSPYAPLDGVEDDVVIDNLSVLYTGRNILSVSPECEGVLVQNCELGWGGGGAASYALDTITGYAAGVQRNGGVGGASSSHNTFRNNYVHDTYQEGLGLETAIEFSGQAFDVTDVKIEDNVFYHCGSALIYFNWDEVANPDHQFRRVSFNRNYVFYSTMSDWVDTGEEVHGFTTGAFTIDGGPNMQDGTVEVRDNVFFAARECLVYIRTYAPEYLPDFEGNIYAQFSDGVFLSSVSAPNYWSANAAEGVRKTLFDESGEVLSLSRSRWGEADW